MSNEYYCPSCASPIPLEDVNVATDIALCRKCGVKGSFSSLCKLPNAIDVLSKPPPKGVRLQHDMMDGSTTVTYRRISPSLLFLIPFTLFWSGISMGGIYGTQIYKGEFDLSSSLFGIPFFLGTIVLVSITLFGLFGKWVVRLNRGDGTIFAGIGIVGWRRSFTYNRTSTVMMQDSDTRVNGKRLQCITVKTDNASTSFGSTIRDDAKEFIAAVLMRELRH